VKVESSKVIEKSQERLAYRETSYELGPRPTSVGANDRHQGSRNRQLIGIMIICAGLLAVPLYGIGDFGLFLLTSALAISLWAVGLDLLVGYTGLLSFGHSAWFGLGAYAAGYTAKEYTGDIFIASLAAVAVVAIVAGAAGFVATRVSGVAFAIVSLAIAACIYLIVAQLPIEFTGGRTGLFGVPAPSVLGRPIAYGNEFYLMTCALTISVVLALRYIVSTPFGVALKAIRDNEIRAKFIGINVIALRWVAFVLSAVVSGLGGMLLCFLQGGMPILMFQFSKSADVLIMVILGGLGTLFGPAAGAIFFTVVSSYLISWSPGWWQIYLGLIFLVVLLLLPGGLAGGFERLTRLVWRESGGNGGNHA
jgi:ABC-type branched-subunit amino acid transport system permease subunit